MKSILTVFCALSLHVAASDAGTAAGDHPQGLGFESPAEADGLKTPAVPEAGAVVLGLIGAMMLLRRRR